MKYKINNKNNKLNLNTITEDKILNKSNGMFLNIINVDDGIYYLDNNWSYTQIQNNRIKQQLYFNKIDSLYPELVKKYIYEENVIKYYILRPFIDDKFKLYSIVPEICINEIESFVNILGASQYYITTPYIFERINGKREEKIIRLIKGKIKKITI